MVNSCAVFGCTNRSTRDKKSYYVLPSVITNQGDQTKELSERRRHQWVANLRRKSFTPSRHTRICSDHFISGKPAPLYDTTNPDWAPTLKMGDTTMEQHKEKKKNLEAAETLLNLALLFQENGINNVNTETGATGKVTEPSCSKATQTDALGPSAALEQSMRDDLQRLKTETMDLREKLKATQISSQTDPLHPSPELLQSMSEEIQRLKTENMDLCKEQKARKARPQADPSQPGPELIHSIREELQRLTTENMDLRKELKETKICPDSFQKDEEKTRFYTGLPSFIAMMTVFSLIEPFIKENSRSPMTKFQKYVMTLMKLRLNAPMQDLAYRFNVSVASVSNAFRHVVDVMYHRLRPLVSWPEREVLQRTMPVDFRRTFGVKVVAILDCLEILTDKPSNALARAQTWSSCKDRNTVKFLIGVAPQGAITFVSNAWGGRASDKFITENCGVLDKLLPCDVVLVDGGLGTEENAGLVCARLKKGRKQLSPLDAEEAGKVAHVRAHFRRVLGNLRNKFAILNGPLPVDFLNSDAGRDAPLVDKIVTLCCGLVNLGDSVVPRN